MRYCCEPTFFFVASMRRAIATRFRREGLFDRPAPSTLGAAGRRQRLLGTRPVPYGSSRPALVCRCRAKPRSDSLTRRGRPPTPPPAPATPHLPPPPPSLDYPLPR